MTPTADTVTLYHNPNCGTSRNVLAAIQAAGHSPKVVEYLKAGWTRPQLQGLLAPAIEALDVRSNSGLSFDWFSSRS